MKGSAHDTTPLEAAIASGHAQVASTLSGHGATVGQRQVKDHPAISPLFLACPIDQAEMVENVVDVWCQRQ